MELDPGYLQDAGWECVCRRSACLGAGSGVITLFSLQLDIRIHTLTLHHIRIHMQDVQSGYNQDTTGHMPFFRILLHMHAHFLALLGLDDS